MLTLPREQGWFISRCIFLKKYLCCNDNGVSLQNTPALLNHFAADRALLKCSGYGQ
jgi:hypothetical protein